MPNKHIIALLTLVLGSWFLTGFSPPVTPSFLHDESLSPALLLPSCSWGWCLQCRLCLGLAPPPGQGFLVCLSLIAIRMSIWALLVWIHLWECPTYIAFLRGSSSTPEGVIIRDRTGGGRPTSGQFLGCRGGSAHLGLSHRKLAYL